MFWKYNSPSSAQIDSLLQQENVRLQELMDEEELLQECKAQNIKVIEFLTQPEILEELVILLVTDPSPDRELQMRFKYANLASELLTCDVPAIVDKVASSSNLLQTLYKFLEKDKPLNPLLASFVSKVFGMLVQRRSEQNWYAYQFTCFQVLDFLKSQGDFVEVAVKHIGTSAVMDLLSKLICGVDDDDQEIKRGIHQWLNECHLIEQLIDKLTPDCDSEEHSSVDQLLSEIVSTRQDASNNGSDSQINGSQSRLLTTLESKDMINKLMDTLLHEDRTESSVSHVINILLTLLSSKSSHKQSNLHHTNSLEIINSDSLDSRSTVLRTILARLPDLQKILMQPTKLGTLMTSYGIEVERIGSTRLKVVNLITALIATQDFYVHVQMASLHTLQLFFDLFFKFSLNNFLHTQVTQCITCIVSQPPNGGGPGGTSLQIDGLNNNPLKLENGEEASKEEAQTKEVQGGGVEEKRAAEDEGEGRMGSARHPMLSQLFSECNIIQKILECYSKEEASSSEKSLHNMVGYLGHMRDIANAIVQSSKEGPCSEIIQTEFKKLPNDVITQWEDFALISLAEINLKNKVIPLQGFKEGDMDNIGDMRFVDDFKETEDGLGGSRVSNQCSDALGDEGSETDMEKFEELCSQRNASDVLDFDDIWKDREKDITFGALQKQDDEENPHSSSEEEGDIDDEFDALRCTEEKMDVDFISEEWGQWLHSEAQQSAGRKEWTEVFDKRGNALSVDSSFNPWQSAPASETAENNSWADFGASHFTPSCDPFVQSDSQSGASFPVFSSVNPCVTSQSSAFQADFSNVLFSSSSQEPGFGVDFSVPPPADPRFKEGQANDPSVSVAQKENTSADVCDASKTVENEQKNVINEEMPSNVGNEPLSTESAGPAAPHPPGESEPPLLPSEDPCEPSSPIPSLPTGDVAEVGPIPTAQGGGSPNPILASPSPDDETEMGEAREGKQPTPVALPLQVTPPPQKEDISSDQDA